MKFTQSAQIPVAREPLWNFLMDVPKVAQSLPGVESVSKIDDTTYQGALKVRVGPISLNLQGKIIVEEQDQRELARSSARRGERSHGCRCCERQNQHDAQRAWR